MDQISVEGKPATELNEVQVQPADQHSDPNVHLNQIDTEGFVAGEHELGARYFRSKFFVGTTLAIAFGLYAGVSAFAYPAPILATINADIGPDPNYIWISYVYNTCMAVTFALLGRLSDIFGRRYFFIGGGVIATVGSIICSRAQNIPTLIGGNVFLGVASGTQLSYHFVLGELIPLKYRYVSVAVLYLCSYPGSGFAPVISNIFISRYSVGWRGLYYILIAINAIATLLWTLFYFPPNFRQKHEGQSKMKFIKQFDYVGMLLLVGGFTVFLFGISSGGTQYAWGSAPPIVMIILGFAALVGLGVWEVMMRLEEPLIPVHLFRRGAWIASVVTLGLAASVYYTGAIIWPYQVNVLYANGNALYAGLLSTLPGLGNISGQVIAGPFVRKIGNQRWQTVIAFTMGAIFTSCCATITLNNKAMLAAFVFLSNICMGWAEIILLINSTILIRDQREIGAAGGLAASIRTGISAVATVVFGTVLNNRLSETVAPQVTTAATEAGLPASSVAGFLQALTTGDAAGLEQVPGITASIVSAGSQALKVAHVDTFRTVYLVSIAFGAVGIITSFFTANLSPEMSGKVAAVLHEEQMVHEQDHKDGPESQNVEKWV